MKLFGESAYHDFRENRLKVDSSERIWSLRVPPRVKHFVWYVGNVYLPGLALWYRYGELLTKQRAVEKQSKRAFSLVRHSLSRALSLASPSLSHLLRSLLAFSAKQATSPVHLVGKLVEFGISSMDTHAFAEEIYSRVPRRSSAAMLARKQKTYSILKADNDSDDDYVDKSSVTTASSRRSDNHKKRFRKKTKVQDDQDDEAMCS
ncbi:hypothetical protein JHK85_032676 [Glycine max]|nr:hypothetical protein JHK85_032676 [Glycine max]